MVGRGGKLLGRGAERAATSSVRRVAVPKTMGISRTAGYKRGEEFARNEAGEALGARRGSYAKTRNPLRTSDTPGPVDYKAPISDRKSGYFTTKEGGVRTGSFGNRTSGSTYPAPRTSTRPTAPPRPAPAGYKSTGTKAPESTGRGPVANDAPLGSRGGPSFSVGGRGPDLGGSFKRAITKGNATNRIQARMTASRDATWAANNRTEEIKKYAKGYGALAVGAGAAVAGIKAYKTNQNRQAEQSNQRSAETASQTIPTSSSIAAADLSSPSSSASTSSSDSTSTSQSPVTRTDSTTGIGGALQGEMRASAKAVRPDRDYMGESFDASLRKGVDTGRNYLKQQLASDKIDSKRQRTLLDQYDRRIGKDTLLGRDRGVGYLKNSDSDQSQKDLLAAYRGRFGNYRKNAKASEVEAMAKSVARKRGE